MNKVVGILALQGAFREHRQILARLGYETKEVRRAADLEVINGLIIPGGESTTMGKLLQFDGLGEKIKDLAGQDFPVYGTCAGMIMLAKAIHDSDQYRLGLMDIEVERNAYGRQVDSFEVDLDIPAIGSTPFRAVFIRAPYIEQVAPNVGILAEYNAKTVFARQGNLLASSFHPELTADTRIHQYFAQIIEEYWLR
jgi:5'-phosphate synthase pdxT subunit